LCLSCGCVLSDGDPADDHGDARALTLADIIGAADATGMTMARVAENIVASLALLPQPEPVVKRLAVPENPQRYILGCAYQCDSVDGHNEFVAKAELEQIAWDYLANHRQIGFHHADGTVTHGTVVESFLHKGDPWVVKAIDGVTYTVREGDWMVGALFDEIGFEHIVRESADGWSVQGALPRRLSPPPPRRRE
jgi:hypothetical protein